MREALAKLSQRDREFVVAYSLYGADTSDPSDGDFAVLLGVTRQTIMNRRKRIRSLGIPLYPFRGRGCQHPEGTRPRSVEELKRDVRRLRRSAAEYARRADRIEAHLAAASVEVASV